MKYIPSQGDIVWLDFDPSAGKEIVKRRPAYVISREAFNSHIGLAIVAPITSMIRGIRLEVILPDAMKTTGSILVYQFKSLDVFQRNVEFIEKSPSAVVNAVRQIAEVIVK